MLGEQRIQHSGEDGLCKGDKVGLAMSLSTVMRSGRSDGLRSLHLESVPGGRW